MAKEQSIFEKIRDISAQLSTAIDADIIFYSGEIKSPNDFDFVKQAKIFKKRPNAMLILTTIGGSADSAYRIARCIQRGYGDGKFILFVDGYCKSAGTLLALGADEIVMSDSAELGPLDVQLSKPDELFESVSGLTPMQAIGALREQAFAAFEDDFVQLRVKSDLQVSTRVALDIAAKLVTGLFEPIFAQLDPMRLGEMHRATQIAHEYGTRLIRDNAKPNTLEHLVHNYPSHGFVVDRDEASTLFEHVREPSELEALLSQLLEPIAESGQVSREPVLVFLSQLEYNANEKSKGPSNEKQTHDGTSSGISGTAGANVTPDSS